MHVQTLEYFHSLPGDGAAQHAAEPARIRVLVVDEHTLLREALSRVLVQEGGFEVAGECSGAHVALEMISRRPVDIVLLDTKVARGQGASLLRRARAAGYRGRFLMMTDAVSHREAASLLKQGASGIFLKNEPVAALIERLRQVFEGKGKLDAISVQAILSEVEHVNRKVLTPRESEVLSGVCKGLANKEIAEGLEVSVNTVKSFIQQLFKKIGVRTRAQLVAVAFERYWDELN